MTFLVPLTGGRDYVLSFESFTGLATTGMAIGAADPDRYIIAACSSVSFNSIITSMTIGGITATPLVQQVAGASVAEIWMAKVPTGSTATVSVTRAGAQAGAIGLYRLLGPNAIGAYATASTTGQTSMATSINVPGKGCAVFAIGAAQNPTPTVGVTGMTVDATTVPVAGCRFVVGSNSFAVAQNPLSISVSISVGSNAGILQSLAVASFGP